MPTVAVTYFSGSGKTRALAQSILAGARGVPGITAIEVPILGAKIVEGRYEDEAALKLLDGADAIVFGSPTYMGMVAGQFKCFADASGGRWYHRTWQDKLAGGFTTSGSPSGDKQGTLLYLAILAAQHGMLWVGNAAPNEVYAGKAPDEATNRLGSFMGVMSQVAPTPEAQIPPGDLRTGEQYGIRIARLAAKR